MPTDTDTTEEMLRFARWLECPEWHEIIRPAMEAYVADLDRILRDRRLIENLEDARFLQGPIHHMTEFTLLPERAVRRLRQQIEEEKRAEDERERERERAAQPRRPFRFIRGGR